MRRIRITAAASVAHHGREMGDGHPMDKCMSMPDQHRKFIHAIQL